MMTRFLAAVGAAVLFLPVAAVAAGTVQLELVGDGSPGASLVFQEWARALGQAGIRNVRIRAGQSSDQVGIAVRGTEASPVYVVTGFIRSSDELVLPSGRFRQSDAGRLAQWLDELARLGPEDRREPKAGFGLAASQFEQILQDAGRRVDFSTQTMTRSAVVDRIAGQMGFPVRLEPDVRQLLGSDPIGEELMGVSSGTALAYLLRPMGLCMAPRMAGGRPAYAVMKSQPDLQIWPVGWDLKKPDRDVLPALYEFHNVNVQNVAASRAIEAIGKLLKVPVLFDHNALARHGIDPSKATVSHPASRTTYSIALRKMLFQAGLKFEVREDEAGQPFLWITTVKPV
jgi:hypothetical protein